MDRGEGGADLARRHLTFHGGVRWLLAFLVLATLILIARAYAGYVVELGPTIPVLDMAVSSAPLGLVLLGLTLAVLRVEGVSAARSGLSPRLLVPAIAAVAGYFIALNAVGIALALAAGMPGTIGYQWTVRPAEAVFVFVAMVVIAGLVEEVVFRGYLQNKFIAMGRGDPKTRIAVGILLASALFSAYHIPRVLADGAPGTMDAAGYLSLLFVNAIGFGLLYEFTHNLYVPILVHAAGNIRGTMGILFFGTGGWPAWTVALYLVTYLGLIVLVVLAYRWWAFRAGRPYAFVQAGTPEPIGLAAPERKLTIGSPGPPGPRQGSLATTRMRKADGLPVSMQRPQEGEDASTRTGDQRHRERDCAPQNGKRASVSAGSSSIRSR